MSANSRLFSLLLTLLTSATFGCGKADLPDSGGKAVLPDLGYVKGTATMDGKPLAGALIAFMPDKGRPGTSGVDAQGKYELFYKKGRPGTKVGPTTVTISWPREGMRPVIPERYVDHPTSELKVDVKEGENTFDFDLASDPEPVVGAPESGAGTAESSIETPESVP